ncbi:MAG: peptidylprolyl isomerase [Reichenbachiella sp.]
MNKKSKIFKEPLVHFGIIGVALFILFSFVNEDETDTQIVIDQYDINEIVSKWNLQWQRDPSPDELKNLLDNYIKEEIFYREALAMNLDHNDEIVKRRMAQKMQFLTQDIANDLVPSDEELSEFMSQSRDKYLKEKTISFEQVYFSPDSRENPLQDAQTALEKNKIKGDYSPIKNLYTQVALSRIRADLGLTFARLLDSLSVQDQWQGPFTSGLGVHLIKVNSIISSESIPLEKVKQQVTDDYIYDAQQQMNEDIFNGLLEKYEVKLSFEGDQQFQ